MQKWIALVAVLCIASISFCQQPSDSAKPLRNILAQIGSEQQNIYLFFSNNHVVDSFKTVGQEAVLTSMFDKIGETESAIQTNPAVNLQLQLIYLGGLRTALHQFTHFYRLKKLSAIQLGDLLDAYKQAVSLMLSGGNIFPLVSRVNQLVGEILVSSTAFSSAHGIPEGREFVVRSIFQTDPGFILPVLYDIPDVPMADSMILAVSRRQVGQLYTYAQSPTSGLGIRIRKLDDPLVKIISQLAQMHSGQLYLPFTDDLLHGYTSMKSITEAVEDTSRVNYYKLLVKTEISSAGRIQKKDTPVAMELLTRMLGRVVVDDFVKKINELHDTLDVVRMRITQKLTAQELYYLLVMSENDIYTSTYLKIYARIFKYSAVHDSYQLLNSVNFDRSKKMIKLAANYNTLADFLSRMNKDKASDLIMSFPDGLERSGTLEDAVDVADSYASISDSRLRKTIFDRVVANLSRVSSSNDPRGKQIYSLLQSLFSSLNPSSHADLSVQFGIPSVYRVNNKTLKDSAGRIIIQQFIYGDKDGRKEFSNFMHAFKRPGWKIEKNEEWVKISSTFGIPVSIYSNLPLDDTTELDAKAQQDLGLWLESEGLQPSVVIHRGHSYHVKYTIAQLPSSAKVVLLGSCGGYNNIAGVLNVCPYAHIVATKQEGTGTINQPMIVYLSALLRKGRDIDWAEIWKYFSIAFKTNGRFADYIPPYKNLGAIFIMAYNKSGVSLK